MTVVYEKLGTFRVTSDPLIVNGLRVCGDTKSTSAAVFSAFGSVDDMVTADALFGLNPFKSKVTSWAGPWLTSLVTTVCLSSDSWEETLIGASTFLPSKLTEPLIVLSFQLAGSPLPVIEQT